ncbi:MAG: response regulator [Planctomycetota bacterium]
MNNEPLDEISQSSVLASFQYRAAAMVSRVSWPLLVCVSIVLVVGGPESRVSVEAPVLIALAIWYFVLNRIFKYVKTFRHLDCYCLGVLVPAYAAAINSFVAFDQNDLIGVLPILVALGGIMIWNGTIFWTFKVVLLVSSFAVAWMAGRQLTYLEIRFLLIFIPAFGTILRFCVDRNLTAFRMAHEEREQLVEERTRSLQEAQLNRKAVETANEHSLKMEAKLNAILDHAPLILCVLSSEAVYLQSRGRGLKLLGLGQDELVGRRHDEVFSDHPELVQAVNQAKLGETSSLVTSIATDDFHEFRFEPVLDANGKVCLIVGVGFEITARVKAEMDQAYIERRLSHTQKMEGLGMIAGAVAHDFKNYLAVIVSYAETLISDQKRGVSETATEVRNAAMQASKVAEQLMVYSGKSESTEQQFEDFELTQVIRSMKPFLNAVARGVNFKIELGSQPIWLFGDQLQLQQLLMNVIKNATDAVDDASDGFVRVRLVNSPQLQNDARLVIGDYRSDLNYFAIEVVDNGPGIADEVLEKISLPHFTTKSDGHGFGMTIAKRILLDHQGVFEFRHHQPKGTCIRMIFPTRPVPSESQDQVSTESELPAISAETVLLVDDELNVLDAVKLLLEATGIKVIATDSPLDAIAKMQQHYEEIDCLILDFSMPEINGLELLNRIRAEGWNHPSILCSGYIMNLDEHPNAQFWPDVFLAKPYRFDELHQAMDEICRNQTRRMKPK